MLTSRERVRNLFDIAKREWCVNNKQVKCEFPKGYFESSGQELNAKVDTFYLDSNFIFRDFEARGKLQDAVAQAIKANKQLRIFMHHPPGHFHKYRSETSEQRYYHFQSVQEKKDWLAGNIPTYADLRKLCL